MRLKCICQKLYFWYNWQLTVQQYNTTCTIFRIVRIFLILYWMTYFSNLNLALWQHRNNTLEMTQLRQMTCPFIIYITYTCIMINMCRYFSANHTGANPPKPCMPGYYCPVQTPSPTRYSCPSGTYSDRSDLAAPEDCYICPQTQYCHGRLTMLYYKSTDTMLSW